MASIPLPALDVRTPQQPDLLEKFGQLQQLRGNAQAMQIRAQQAPLQQQQLEQNVQGGQIDLQMKQQQQKDQQAMTASMNQWDGKSLDELVPLVLKNGGSANAVMGLKQHALEQKAKISAIAKDDAETGKNQIETAMKKNDAVSGALGSILQVPDEQLPQALIATAQQLSQQGLLDPQHVQLAQQLAQSGNPQQIRQQLDVMRKGITSNSQLMEQAKADQQAANQDMLRKQEADAHAETLRHNRADEKLSGARVAAEFNRQRQENTGTLSIAQVPDGKGGMKSVLLNNKTGEIKETDAGLTKPSATQPSMGQPTTADRNRASLAKVALANIDKIDEIVSRRGDLLGVGAGRVSNIDQLLGSNDPDLVALVNEAHNFSMANAGVHGSRSVMNVRDAVKDLLGDLHNGPKGIKGGLDANRANLKTIIANGGGGTANNDSSAPPSGAKVRDYTQLGNK